VEKRAGETAIVLADDPALKIDAAGAQEVYFPGRKFGGRLTFRIPGVASVLRTREGIYQANLMGPTEVSLPK
jgi:hypothetical protein